MKRTKTSKDLPSSTAVSGSSLSSFFCRKRYIRRSLQLRENYRHTTKRVWLRRMQGLPAESLIHDCRDSPFLSGMSLSSPLTLATIALKSFCAVMKDGSFWTGMSWQVSFVSTKSRLYAFVGKKTTISTHEEELPVDLENATQQQFYFFAFILNDSDITNTTSEKEISVGNQVWCSCIEAITTLL